MEILLAFALLLASGAVLWFLSRFAWGALKGAFGAGRAAGAGAAAGASAEAEPVERVLLAPPESPVDLRVVVGVSCPVAATEHWATREERAGFADHALFLRREPAHPHDPNAVAVYGGERKLGYLPAGRSVRYAALLDRLGAEFVVSRDAAKPRLSLLLPSVADLRARAEARAGEAGEAGEAGS